MKHMNYLMALLLYSLLGMAPAYGQSAGDSSRAVRPVARAKKSSANSDKRAELQKDRPDELVLGEITIEAVIEKPTVDIIPHRKKPKVEEISFIDRSFAAEIKVVPREFHLFDDELDKPRKLDKLKLKLLKKKK